MSDVDLVTQDVCEDDLGNISGECVSIEGERGPILEERTSSSGTHPSCRLTMPVSEAHAEDAFGPYL